MSEPIVVPVCVILEGAITEAEIMEVTERVNFIAKKCDNVSVVYRFGSPNSLVGQVNVRIFPTANTLNSRTFSVSAGNMTPVTLSLPRDIDSAIYLAFNFLDGEIVKAIDKMYSIEAEKQEDYDRCSDNDS
jgi:hypothetical protein